MSVEFAQLYAKAFASQRYPLSKKSCCTLAWFPGTPDRQPCSPHSSVLEAREPAQPLSSHIVAPSADSRGHLLRFPTQLLVGRAGLRTLGWRRLLKWLVIAAGRCVLAARICEFTFAAPWDVTVGIKLNASIQSFKVSCSCHCAVRNKAWHARAMYYEAWCVQSCMHV